jgi:hypothetical protein
LESPFFGFLLGFFWAAACFLGGVTGLAALARVAVFAFV